MSDPAVLFVCLGNICRSPLAEAAFRVEMARAGLALTVDSAGTAGWHAGEPPDPRAQAVARRHGIDIAGYRARRVTPQDFTAFSHIVAMDPDNLDALRAICPIRGTAALSLLLDHVDGHQGRAVADPFYGDDAGFDVTWSDVSAGAAALVRQLTGR